MLERVESLPDPFPKFVRQTCGIMNRSHVNEGIELLAINRGNVFKTKRQGLKAEPIAVVELPRVQGLALQFEKEFVSLDGIVEQKGHIEIGTRGDFPPSSPSQSHHGKGTIIAKQGLLLGGPLGQRSQVDPAPLGHD